MRSWMLGAVLVTVMTHAVHADDDPNYVCKVPPASTKIKVQFRPQTSIDDLATWVMGFTCKNIIIDGDVLGRVPTVTIMAPNQMSPKQAYQLFVDAVEATGLVVVTKKDSVIVKLGPGMPRSCPAVATTSPSTKTTSVPPNVPPDTTVNDTVSAELGRLMDAGIKRVDDTHYTVSRALRDAVLADPMPLAKGARVVPAVENGKPAGFKLYAIRPSSLYARVGFQNGDRIESVNGYVLSSLDVALEAWAKVKDAKQLTFKLTRRGSPVTHVITIQ